MHTIDLNADLGEGGGRDEELMALASSVNIACGGHAGDRESIRHAVGLAIGSHAAIGAHPGYEDPAHFGRRDMELTANEIRALIHRQLERILEIHPRLHHVKPHGALYNQSNRDDSMAEALVTAIAGLQPGTILYCPPHGALAKAAAGIGLKTCAEGFIDRRYGNDGNLCPRDAERALIRDIDEAVSQALRIAIQQSVTTPDGTSLPMPARTLCIHGDSRDAVEFLSLTRSKLEEAGIRIVAP